MQNIGEGRVEGRRRDSCQGMGVSRSRLRGARVFEAVGLRQDCHRSLLPRGRHRVVGGIGLDVISAGSTDAPPSASSADREVNRPHRFRSTVNTNGARAAVSSPIHASRSIACRRAVVQLAAQRIKRTRRALIATVEEALCTLRGLLDFKPAGATSLRSRICGRSSSASGPERRCPPAPSAGA